MKDLDRGPRPSPLPPVSPFWLERSTNRFRRTIIQLRSSSRSHSNTFGRKASRNSSRTPWVYGPSLWVPFFCCCSFVIWNDRSLWRFWPEHALRFARRTQGFLKKEFSHENIYFWAACERFHRLFPTEDTTTASYEAQKIFERHLGPAASEPVNVDSQARQKAEDNLCQPGPELFDQVTTCLFVFFLFRWIFYDFHWNLNFHKSTGAKTSLQFDEVRLLSTVPKVADLSRVRPSSSTQRSASHIGTDIEWPWLEHRLWFWRWRYW